jgi:hypothetical protein
MVNLPPPPPSVISQVRLWYPACVVMRDSHELCGLRFFSLSFYGRLDALLFIAPLRDCTTTRLCTIYRTETLHSLALILVDSLHHAFLRESQVQETAASRFPSWITGTRNSSQLSSRDLLRLDHRSSTMVYLSPVLQFVRLVSRSKHIVCRIGTRVECGCLARAVLLLLWNRLFIRALSWYFVFLLEKYKAS